MFITISISSAPASTAWLHSKALTSVGDAPRGNPITVQMLTSVPASIFFARGIQQGFKQTATKFISFAYNKKFLITYSGVSYLRTVWSIYAAIFPGFIKFLFL